MRNTYYKRKNCCTFCAAVFLLLFVRKSGCKDAKKWLNRERIFPQGEEHHGTTEHAPAQCGLCDLFLQRHLRHQRGCGGQSAAGALRLCLRHDRYAALPDERGQPAGGAADGHAAQCAGHEAQCAAADHRLCGGLRRHGADRRSGAAGSGLFCGGHRQGQRYQYLYHSGQRSLRRPHPGHEPDAQLLRLRRTAVPLPHCGGSPGKHRAGRLSAGSRGPCALAGVRLYPAARRQE